MNNKTYMIFLLSFRGNIIVIEFTGVTINSRDRHEKYFVWILLVKKIFSLLKLYLREKQISNTILCIVYCYLCSHLLFDKSSNQSHDVEIVGDDRKKCEVISSSLGEHTFRKYASCLPPVSEFVFFVRCSAPDSRLRFKRT